MALVAYDYSDSSDVEENATEETKKIEHEHSETESLSEPKLYTQPHASNVCNILFNLLPQPAKTNAIEEDEDEFLHKKGVSNIIKPKAKITVPSPSDFKDIEDNVPKPKVASGKKSGLLSMLPQPKHSVSIMSTTKSFVPHVLTKKPASTIKKQPLPSPSSKTKSLSKDYSDESDDEEVQNDFFSIHKTEMTVEDIPLDTNKQDKGVINTSIANNKKQTSNILSYFKQDEVEDTEALQTNVINHEEQRHYQSYENSNHESDLNVQPSEEIAIDDEAIIKLCGTRGKRKREEIQIVNINQKEVLADAKDWLLKGLMDDTSKRMSVSKRRGDEPTSQQKRKHQITYLAHQAKANEAELQNQWANNRVSKRQTQSKYGF
ncbi:unnamed protein product [Chilo suppressalis]|uniref:Proline-rich protein PRCC n=1 Tax=Chilo suppressalis TaxID=168631 RepID=A0ABN8BBL2_CHISP|nr:unnamed protein product [Chilo suppressalis]